MQIEQMFSSRFSLTGKSRSLLFRVVAFGFLSLLYQKWTSDRQLKVFNSIFLYFQKWLNNRFLSTVFCALDSELLFLQ